MRIVTTTCSNTEIVAALGCADWIVGVDDHSDYPEDVVTRAARVGPDLGVDPAKVAALRPDLVIASLTVPGHEKVVESLERAGLPVIAPEPRALADVARDIRDIAGRLGVPEAGERLAAEFEAAMQPVPVASEADRPSVVIEWWPKPVIVPGRDSWATDLLRLAGGRNPLEHEDVKSRPLEPGELAEIDPDAVVLSWCGIEYDKYRESVALEREGCEKARYVQNGHVFKVSEAYLGRPGPRLVDGLGELRKVVAALRSA